MSTNEIIAAYIAAKAAEKAATEAAKAANKTAEEMKARLLEIAGDRDNITTDKYTAIIKDHSRTDFDSKRFCAEFPDAKKEYPKVATWKTIDAREIATA